MLSMTIKRCYHDDNSDGDNADDGNVDDDFDGDYADVMLMMTMLIMIMPRVMMLMMTMVIRELVDDDTVSLKRWPTTNTGGRSSMSSTGESVL